MVIPLLKTKLYIPPLRPGWVFRPHLVERLDAGLRLGCKLTLLSAPAGFGKTTLLSEWIAGCAQDTRVAWISLDQEDNDLARLLAYLAAAIQTVEPGLGQNALARVQPSQPPDTEAMLIDLINVLADCRGAIVLVLDDGHEIAADVVHNALTFLLDHLPPHAHMVIATRVDPPWPLALLRSRQEMIELRAQDLRFTLEEAAAFLNNTLGFALSAKDIAALDARTEGWIAGLQMAALSMRGQEDAAAFIQAFSGSHRFVLDYLVEQVLDQQDDALQTFLLQTSILERLTAPLCDAVVQEGGLANSQTTLDYLDRANLFVVPLDDERRWYRYHHLFADLLRRRLASLHLEQVAEGHVRASAWYESQGSIHEAISHALAAADYERAARLVERYGGQALMRGEVVRVDRWIDALPEEMVRARPLLCLARAWTLGSVSETTDRAISWMERAHALSAANPRPLSDPGSPYRTDHEMINENARFFRITIAQRQAAPEKVVVLCLEALQTLPEADTYTRSAITFYLAQAYQRLGDREAAERALGQARQLGLIAEGHAVALVVAGIQAGEAWDRGDLHAVARICREAIASLVRPAEQTGEPAPYACLIDVYLGRTLVEWNELEQAEPLLLRGIELAERIAEPGVQVDGCRDLARLHWMQGNFQEAHAWMDKALQACRWDAGYLHALHARIWLAQAENDPRWLDEAIQWADGCALADPGEYSWELQSLVRVRIAQYRAHGKPDLLPVLAVLDGHIEAPADKSSGWQAEVLALEALLLYVLGRTAEAMPPLARALTIAQTTGHALIFLEHGPPMIELLREAVRRDIETGYARQLMAAFEARGCAGQHMPSPGAKPAAQTAPIEPLSERELQVLRLLKSALTQREIADQLYLSVNTVRSHAKNLYAKLGARSRIEAIARAEELGLL
ncbi:MAG: hypothetical protein JW934_21430 [Anaerolineae bacterium]|nr:hypothetical protein [Anaerolineae bacterium]